MRLATYRDRDRTRYGVVGDDEVVDLAAAWQALKLPAEPPAHLRGLLGEGPALLERIAESVERAPAEARVPLSRIRWLPPVPNPRKLLCLAGNYLEHIQEGRSAPVEFSKRRPDVFMKPASTTLKAHKQPVVLSRAARSVDWEVELAVVIGTPGRYLGEEEAMEHVAGYTILNDLSERALHVGPEREPSARAKFFDWLNGKWFDGFAPCGPYLVTADAVADPHDLSLQLEVNGVLEQDGHTGQMIYRIPEILAYVSAIMTLEPGDIIATGTPHGVGSAKGKSLHAGDRVEARISAFGRLTTPITGPDA